LDRGRGFGSVRAVDALVDEVDRSPDGPTVGAFFDFDGTLIYGFSAVALQVARLRRRDVSPPEVVHALITGVGLVLGQADYDAVVSILGRAWRGRPVDEIDELGRRLFKKKLAGRVYPEARALVAAHQRKGHTLVLASSALSFQVEAMAADLDIEHVLCTRFEVADGKLTGRLAGPHLWGAGKRHAVVTLAAEQGIDLAASFAYADGSEDAELLEVVGHPRATNPTRGLERTARDRGWPVHRFAGRGPATPELVVRHVAAIGGFLAATATGIGLGLLNRSRADAVNTMVSVGSDVSLGLADIRLDVIGEEHLWSHRPAVFLFNHQSSVDALLLMALLRRDVTAVAKKELAANPIVRLAGMLADAVFIDRADSAGAIDALRPLVERALARGKSLAVAPEGTRSGTGRLGPFKKGAFRLAMAGGVPVVPIVLRNAGDVWPLGTPVMRPGTVDVVVHAPIPTAEWTDADLDARIAEVRRLYLETLADWPAR
jgi:putative phosphoserine phosphatase / 1-acylglycerol-3-phosphate O-acyltransferase